ncbi:MAG: MarR family transcriptional regulator [Beijerinckiaceae bacterium]|nr:MarR family transcriptional regulator [Beijerinckiaceae bacterium]MCZ8300133.1 MarR family transcriptional regulator [Beijerinckiaceae bacterium]
MTDHSAMPGHLARRFQQIAVAVFHAEVEAAGFDLTPVQYVALAMLREHPGIDQATLAGLIAYDRTTIGGVIDRLVQKGLMARAVSPRDRRAHVLHLTEAGLAMLAGIRPAVEAAQREMVAVLEPAEAKEFIRLLQKVIAANERDKAPTKPVS